MAGKFWIGGTGTWDNTNDVNWSTTSGGINDTTHPTSGDTATLDSLSGGGTVTVNATLNISALTYGAFTGTLDFATNNNNINIGTVTPFATAVNASGTGSRTLNMGNGTWTIATTNGGSYWLATVITSYTQNQNSSTVVLNTLSGLAKTFNGNSKVFNAVTINAMSGTTGNNVLIAGAGTITTLTLNATCNVQLSVNVAVTTLAVSGGSSSALTLLRSNTPGTARTITLTNNFTPSWLALSDITFSGGTNTASSSFDLGNNTSITITAPSGGSVTGIIGS